MDSPTLDEGLAALKKCEYRRGEEIFRSLIGREKTPTPEMRIFLARTLQGQERVDEAVKCLHDALALSPESKRAHAALGDIHRFRGGHGKAIDCYNASLAAETDDLRSPEYHDFIRDNLASCYESCGNPGRAEEILRELIRRNPHTPRYCQHLYDILIRQNRRSAADAVIKACVTFYNNPDDARIVSLDEIEITNLQDKKLVIYGIDPLYGHDRLARDAHEWLRGKNLDVHCFVDTEVVAGEFDGKPVYSVYDLLLEEKDSFVIISLYTPHAAYASRDPFASSSFQTLVLEMLGVRRDAFLPISVDKKNFDVYEVDLSLGANIKHKPLIGAHLPGFVVFGGAGGGDAVKIVVLGGSTSDSLRFALYHDGVKSWPELLHEFLDGNGIPAVVYSGAVAGHNSNMELLKCLRDVVLLSPDVVVSYSGVNEYQTLKFPFDGFFQNQLLEKIKDAARSEPSAWSFPWNFPNEYTNGMQSDKSVARHLIDNMRMMRALGAEFSFSYVPVLQAMPPFGDANQLEHIDRWCLLWGIDPQKFTYFTAPENFEEMKNQSAPYPYIAEHAAAFHGKGYDLFFDHCHVTTRGNRIIAQKVYEDLSGMGLLKGKSR